MKLYWQDKGARLVCPTALMIAACVVSLLSLGSALLWWSAILPFPPFILPSLAIISVLIFWIGSRLPLFRLSVGVLALLIPGAFLAHAASSNYVDITAGRIMVEYRVVGIPYYRSIRESQLTACYREIISPELPNPEWWFNSSTETGLGVGMIHSDSFTYDVYQGAEILGEVVLTNDFPAPVKRQAIQNYLDLLQVEGLRRSMSARAAVDYAARVREIAEAKEGRFEPSDLPEPYEFARKWLEENYGE